MSGESKVLCAGLGPGEEPGTWRPCKLEKDHDSPCEPVPDEMHERIAKLTRNFEELGEAYGKLNDSVTGLTDEMERLRSQFHDDTTEFGRAVHWTLDFLHDAASRVIRHIQGDL